MSAHKRFNNPQSHDTDDDSASMDEAEQEMVRLCGSVNKLLQDNESLQLRLRNTEGVCKADLAANAAKMADAMERRNFRASGSMHVASTSMKSSKGSSHSIKEESSEGSEHSSHYQVSNFEEQLHTSRVYRHAAVEHRDSIIGGARSAAAVSILSSLTLEDMSKLSLFELPVYPSELSNGTCYNPPQKATQGSASKRERRFGQVIGLKSWWKSLKGPSEPPQTYFKEENRRETLKIAGDLTRRRKFQAEGAISENPVGSGQSIEATKNGDGILIRTAANRVSLESPRRTWQR